MFRVYIVLDDCPSDFGDVRILRAYMTRSAARRYIQALIKRNSYLYQYVVIKPLSVRAQYRKEKPKPVRLTKKTFTGRLIDSRLLITRGDK